jgi:hypothetical protein
MPGIILGPDAKVQELGIDLAAGAEQLTHVPPIHADIEEGAAQREGGLVSEASLQEHREAGEAHLARRHRKGAVMDISEPGAVTVDRHVVGRIGEHYRGALLAHQALQGRGVEDTSAQHPVIAEQPQIARFADGRTRSRFDLGIGRIFGRRFVVEAGDPQIDLAHLEADDLDAEVEIGKGEVPELLGKEPPIPLGILAEPVVGDHQGAALCVVQPLERDGWDLGPAELAAGEDPAMPGDDIALVVDQGRDGEAEGLDRARQLLDLLGAVPARVLGLEL